jgi:hypothetical protein
VPRLHVTTNAKKIAQSAAMDGIFPLRPTLRTLVAHYLARRRQTVASKLN